MLHTIEKVEYIEAYKLKLQFSNGETKTVDLAPTLKGAKHMFLPLLDVGYFKRVKCDGITIVWPNGVDLCPDVLYRIGIRVYSKSRRKAVRVPKSRKRLRVNS